MISNNVAPRYSAAYSASGLVLPVLEKYATSVLPWDLLADVVELDVAEFELAELLETVDSELDEDSFFEVAELLPSCETLDSTASPAPVGEDELSPEHAAKRLKNRARSKVENNAGDFIGLLPNELFVGLGHGVVGRVAFDSHFQVVLVAEFCNRLHHG